MTEYSELLEASILLDQLEEFNLFLSLEDEGVVDLSYNDGKLLKFAIKHDRLEMAEALAQRIEYREGFLTRMYDNWTFEQAVKEKAINIAKKAYASDTELVRKWMDSEIAMKIIALGDEALFRDAVLLSGCSLAFNYNAPLHYAAALGHNKIVQCILLSMPVTTLLSHVMLEGVKWEAKEKVIEEFNVSPETTEDLGAKYSKPPEFTYAGEFIDLTFLDF